MSDRILGTYVGTVLMGHRYPLYAQGRPDVVDIYRSDETTKPPIGRAQLTATGSWYFTWAIFGDGSGAWIAAFREQFETIMAQRTDE
ncbi:hypothetical protein [Natronoglycomyces albus]|uniref:Uncharacterized protein n=1 Tax=Natronoglycomyces albus TaxID=2811108 RepID=A0A895XKJ5_9ACTN|nr:hypothetical protein [Natronoglycomyces albus]QSB06261.1 hypothetical protein JQS30_04960 [Natronoglycomyces albus]